MVAFDVSEEMLGRAREHNPALANVPWVHGDGMTLAPIEDGSADGVFSHVVFQHLPDPAITLGYVRRWGACCAPAAGRRSRCPTTPRCIGGACSPAAPRHRAWRGSAVDLDMLRATAEHAGLDVERVVGEGTQFCLVRLRRRGS